jgi:hypothetical protein
MKLVLIFILTFVSLLFLLIGITGAATIEPNSLFNQSAEPLWIQINPIEDHHVGDIFTISGTTNIPVGENISVEIFDDFFRPGGMSYQDKRSVTIYNNGSINIWSTTVNFSTMSLARDVKTGVYSTTFDILVTKEGDSASNYTSFELYPTNLTTQSLTPTPTRAAGSSSLSVLLPVLSLGLAGAVCMAACRKRP